MSYANIKTLLLATLTSYSISAQTFTESSIALGITHEYLDSSLMGGGAAFFDYNNDGYDDLFHRD